MGLFDHIINSDTIFCCFFFFSFFSRSNTIMSIMVSYVCRICKKRIDDDTESSILCDICNSWIQSKFNHLNFLDFQHINGNSNDPWFCFKCTCKIFPFGNLNNQNVHSFIHNNSEMNESSVGKYSNGNNTLKLNPPPNLKFLFNQFNELTADSNNKPLSLTVEILI